MESLANLESFARSAEHRSFSEAARRLALTPAAVSRNVAMLERNLGARLFQRSTRGLVLTEVGERFLQSIGESLEALQAAIIDASSGASAPAGRLKVSVPPTTGMAYILPLLPSFLERYPLIKPEWHFETRPIDIVREGYDAAIGGGFELAPGIISRTLSPTHIVAVASPQYLDGKPALDEPSGLRAFDGIMMRSLATGRVRYWKLRDASGSEILAPLKETIVVNDHAAMRQMALLGLGVAMLAMQDVVNDLEEGRLVRVLPKWYADAGGMFLYYPSKTLLPAKTRVFIDFVTEAFKKQRLAERFAGDIFT
jgi:DNA-binding transcriptional LysR family regulator